MKIFREFVPSVILLLTILTPVFGISLRQAEVPVETKCSGGFDIYFVLDTSSSISVSNFQNQTVNFVEELYARFTSPNLRVSIITFSSVGRTNMPLTGDRTVIREGILELRSISPDGTTQLAKGLEHANQQIKLEGGNSASVVIGLTDGRISDKTESEIQSNITREFGGSVLMVRVAESTTDDLVRVADHPWQNHTFRGETFNDLESIIAEIIDTSCVEILRVTPDEVCPNEAFNISIFGNGFDKTVDPSLISCNFKLNDTNSRVKPTTVSSTHLVCESPKIPENGLVQIQVSLNNISFVSSNVTVVAKEDGCEPPNVLPIVLGLLAAGLLIALFLLWFFLPLCCAVVVKEEAPKPRPVSVVREEPPPPPPPAAPEAPRLVPGPSKVKSWPKVDVSLIGGVGLGGIRPVAVRWGTSGNTEAALHLERGRQATVVGAIEVETQGPMVPERPPPPRQNTPPPPPPPPPRVENTPSRGCCAACSCIPETFSKIVAPIKSFYDKVALMRPQPGDKGRCCTCRRELVE